MKKPGAFLPRSQHSCASAHEQVYDCASSRTSSSCLLCLICLVCSGVPILVLAWALQCLTAGASHPLYEVWLRPHPDPVLASLSFCSTILFFSGTELSTCLGLVYGSQSSLQHLQSNVFPEKPSAHKNLGDDAIVLITSVYVGAYSAVMDQIDEPFMGLFRIRLSFSAPVCKFWSVDSSNPNM